MEHGRIRAMNRSTVERLSSSSESDDSKSFGRVYFLLSIKGSDKETNSLPANAIFCDPSQLSLQILTLRAERAFGSLKIFKSVSVPPRTSPILSILQISEILSLNCLFNPELSSSTKIFSLLSFSIFFSVFSVSPSSSQAFASIFTYSRILEGLTSTRVSLITFRDSEKSSSRVKSLSVRYDGLLNSKIMNVERGSSFWLRFDSLLVLGLDSVNFAGFLEVVFL